MQDFKDEASRLADLAAEVMAERTGSTPAWDEASLQIVEETLDEASGYANQLSKSKLEGLVQQFGCYILEVARQEFGGIYAWYEVGNEPVLVVDNGVSHVALMTWGRVRSRLGGDKADNIPFFFDGFASRVRENKPGTRATYM